MSDQNLRKRKLEILEILETIRTIIQCNIFKGLTIVCFLFFQVQKYRSVYKCVFTGCDKRSLINCGVKTNLS